jgi:hypothetical protein
MIIKTPLPFYHMADGDQGAGGGDGNAAPGADKREPAPGDDGKSGDQGNDQSKPDPAPGADGMDQANAKKKDDGTFLGGADDLDEKATKGQGKWPDNWRDEIAGGDKDFRKHLDRYASPADYMKAGYAAQQKIRSGNPVADDEPMPDPEKEPEKAKEWRKARGIPDDPTGYAVPDEVAKLVTDEDKPRLALFTEAMHQAGVPQKYAGAAMAWYFKEQEAANAVIAEADKADKAETEDKLREEWGSDFRANSTVAKRFAEEITPGINWFEARLPDGRKLGNIPDFVMAINRLGLAEYGDVTFAGRDAADRSTNRMKEIELIMQNDPDRYTAELRKEYEALMEGEVRRKEARGSLHTPDRERA